LQNSLLFEMYVQICGLHVQIQFLLDELDNKSESLT